MLREEIVLWGWNLLVYPFHSSCSTGELHPGLSGWKNEHAEVLELLIFGKMEQQAAHWLRIWRPRSKKSHPLSS